jgi:hypothetical protein
MSRGGVDLALTGSQEAQRDPVTALYLRVMPRDEILQRLGNAQHSHSHSEETASGIENPSRSKIPFSAAPNSPGLAMSYFAALL